MLVYFMTKRGLGIMGIVLFFIALLITGVILAQPIPQNGNTISQTRVGVGNYIVWFLAISFLAMLVVDVIALAKRLGLLEDFFRKR
jgi:hypothetical protein